jgi:hypothetical protein
MESIIAFCNRAFHAVWNVVQSDHYFFYSLFPESYNLIFLLVRVIPVIFLAGTITYTIKIHINNFKQPLPTVPDELLKKLLFMVMVGGVLLRIYFASTNESITYGNDAAARLLQAKEWYAQPNYIPGNMVWLPFYYPLILMLVPFGFDALMSSKIIVLILSVVTIPIFHASTTRIFNSSIAFVATLFLTINPFHILYSSFAMSENLFLFFVVVAFYFLVRYTEVSNIRYMALSSIFINAACMIRYEGWVLAGLFPLYLFFKRKDIRQSVVYFMGNTLLILLYCLVSYTTHEVLIYGVHVATADVQADLATRKNHLQHIYSRFSSELIFPVWQYILLLLSVIYALVKWYKMKYLFVWMVLLGISAFKVFTGSSQPFWRYFSFTLIMLLPYMAYLIFALSRNHIKLWSAMLLCAILLSIPLLLHSYQYRKEMSNAPTDYKEACAMLKRVKKPKEIIIGDVRILGEDHSSFQLDADVSNTELYQPMKPWMKVFSNYEVFNNKTLIRLIDQPDYHYLFIQKNLILDSVFYSASVQQYLPTKNIITDTLFNSNKFQLIRIVHK